MSTLESLSPWSKGSRHDDALEQRLSELFGGVPEPEGMSELSRSRVGARLRAPAKRGGALLLVRLVALGVVLGITGAAAAQWAAVHFLSPQTQMKAPPAPAPEQRAPLLRPARTLTPQEGASARNPPAAVETAHPETPAVSTRPVAPPPSSSSRLGQEAASLELALSALRGGGDGRAGRGLEAIDRHLREFPNGPLELEARVARVDALLLLGRRQDARRELSALPIERVGRKHELRLIRAELRSDDDCRAAISDFDVLVGGPLPAAWAERALFGRGACLLKVGDRAGAERDFARYLREFPRGRFAEQIRAQKPE